jgi:hypothetical protein
MRELALERICDYYRLPITAFLRIISPLPLTALSLAVPEGSVARLSSVRVQKKLQKRFVGA